ncbi:hypothetical protein C5N14_08870 [Micromonospora sp. MW-13]|uniref:hypothetical protein n=1 Tax=Micromonospora sp. MW-13 TaxID=2094022 RepID=UPI000ED9DC30|nr:hypothetical protein [Micromonospora sp. MW-13]RGC69373.1 hypothetical protein C5N14_08870 [Micromonospora sp. MW-13]
MSLLLGATGVAALVSQLPVALGASPGTKLLLWFVSAPFMVVAVVLLLQMASIQPGPDDHDSGGSRPHRPVDG